MLTEARQALPALKAHATAPAGEAGVTRVVGSRFAIYPQREMDVNEQAAWWGDYFDALADIPEGALEAGMKVWIRNPANEFMPKPGQLRQLALQTENREARAYERARQACQRAEDRVYEPMDIPPAEPRQMPTGPTEADRERVKAWARDFAAQIPRRVRPDFPASHGAVDETGLTAEMRARLEAR